MSTESMHAMLYKMVNAEKINIMFLRTFTSCFTSYL